MLFYLGTHRPNWLSETTVPLFVSRRRLQDYKTLPRAKGRWALDSGGFTELSTYGAWQLTEQEYVTQARRYRDEVGPMDFAAPMDWMCEPFILRMTGLTVPEHQERTTANYLRLREMAPDVPFIPVLQGWKLPDYLRHAETYANLGVTDTLFGLGTVCRRQNTTEAADIVWGLAAEGLRLHGFGFKITGLRKVASLMESADSMAWSFAARRSNPLPGHTHKNCNSCFEYAMRWYARVQVMQDAPLQLRLFTRVGTE